jgi:uncharacterized protein YkwD
VVNAAAPAVEGRGVEMRRRSLHVAAGLFAFAALLAPAGGQADGGAAAAKARAKIASDRCQSADALPGQVSVTDAREATLCLMNAQRTARGLKRLRAQPDLGEAASRFARQMVRDRFFDHTSPGGSTMVSRIKGTSYLHDAVRWTVGENLAWGTGTKATPRATVEAWMHSADHRENLLDRGFADVGIGIAAGAPAELEAGETGSTYVTDFGRRVRG